MVTVAVTSLNRRMFSGIATAPIPNSRSSTPGRGTPSSAVGKGVAVPNARSLAVTEPRLVIARARRGLEWGASDRVAVQLVLLVLSTSEMSVDSHLERVMRAIAITRTQRNRLKLLEAEDARIVTALLREAAL